MYFPTISILKGDLMQAAVDAIVNPANKDLLGGGGLDGAIHSLAGKGLFFACQQLSGCKTGEAKITAGYNLTAKHIIHTVGPIYGQEGGKEKELLSACYENSLLLATANKLTSIAFPAISTGNFLYPKEEAAQIAIETTIAFFKKNTSTIKKVLFILPDQNHFNIFSSVKKNKRSNF